MGRVHSIRPYVAAVRLLARPVLLAMPSRYRRRCARRIAERLSQIAPDRSEPYKVDKSTIYLNLAESRMMAMRAIGLYEPEKRQHLKSVLKAGSCFVDAGANKGDFSLFASRLVGPSGRVIAVEPEPLNARELKTNIALNGYSNVEIVEAALSDKDLPGTLFIGEKSGFHTLKAGQPQRQCGQLQVSMRRLDSLAEQLHVTNVDALKIDVEGGEIELLRGAEAIIRQSAAISLLIDLHPHLGVDIPSVEELLCNWGLRFFRVDAPDRELKSLPRRPGDVIARR